MRLHLCGPMRGLPHFNFQAFSAAAAALRARGHTVTCPTEHDREVGFDPFLGADPAPEVLQRMVAWNLGIITVGQVGYKYGAPVREPLDGVVLLPGWRQSEGASLEALVAERCGRKLFLFGWDYDGFLLEQTLGSGLTVSDRMTITMGAP